MPTTRRTTRGKRARERLEPTRGSRMDERCTGNQPGPARRLTLPEHSGAVHAAPARRPIGRCAAIAAVAGEDGNRACGRRKRAARCAAARASRRCARAGGAMRRAADRRPHSPADENHPRRPARRIMPDARLDSPHARMDRRDARAYGSTRRTGDRARAPPRRAGRVRGRAGERGEDQGGGSGVHAEGVRVRVDAVQRRARGNQRDPARRPAGADREPERQPLRRRRVRRRDDSAVRRRLALGRADAGAQRRRQRIRAARAHEGRRTKDEGRSGQADRRRAERAARESRVARCGGDARRRRADHCDAALDAYRHGVGSITDAMPARNDLLAAQTAYADSYGAALSAAASLALATGTVAQTPEAQ